VRVSRLEGRLGGLEGAGPQLPRGLGLDLIMYRSCTPSPRLHILWILYSGSFGFCRKRAVIWQRWCLENGEPCSSRRKKAHIFWRTCHSAIDQSLLTSAAAFFKRALRLDDVLADGVAHEFAHGVQAKLAHDI